MNPLEETMVWIKIRTISLEIEFPRCNGEDPARWISQAKLVFRFHQMTGYIKGEIHSINLEGEAMTGVIWMENVMGCNSVLDFLVLYPYRRNIS